MIGILSQGRLGNQMFQYTFIYAASKKLNKPFFIISYNSLHYFKLYEDLEKNNTKNIFKFIVFNLLKKSSVKISRKIIRTPIKWLKEWATHKNIFIWHNTSDENHYLLENIRNNILYSGFFQSENYFKYYDKEIKELFEINSLYSEDFEHKKKNLFEKKVIAIHVRQTDYLNFGNKEIGGMNMTLPINYYKKCLSLISNIDSYNILFISDDIEFVKSQFRPKVNYFYENNDEIIDFQLLLHADILIIANSTFSWWAAWLNQKVNKIVYAPNYFLGFKIKKFYPAGIKINNWNWIDVN